MIWILWGVLGAILLSSIGIVARLNIFHQGLWGLLAILMIPIVLGNACAIHLFMTASRFTVAFFVFTGVYALAGMSAGIFVFGDKLSFAGWMGVGMIVLGVILLRGVK